ncbi:hypothetical protein PFISCL1PPCAC_26926, partial [Pristionchus fissidentatus]
ISESIHSTMHITIYDGDRITNVDLTDDCPVENLLALAMADLGNDNHDASAVKLLKEGTDVLGKERERSLAACGLKDGDLLVYSYAAPAAAPSSTAASTLAAASSLAGPSSGNDDLDEKRKRLAALFGQSSFVKEIKKIKLQKSPEEEEEEKCKNLYDQMIQPHVKSKVYQMWPAMLETYLKNPQDYVGFKKEYVSFMTEEKRKIAAMNNQFSAEGQALLMEQIRQDNCQRLYNQVQENQPEFLISVHMLYCKIKVNDAETFAFIDSGAQISFMSKRFAEKAGLEHIIDKRFNGLVNGIGGSDRMIGRIHACELEIGDAKFDAKMDVMNDKFDVLIGLDFMRRHGCCIDLKNNRLSFNETTFAEFLSDAEVAAYEKEREALRDTKFKVDDDKLAQIMGMGFSKKDAEDALRDSANDVPHAVRMLFDQAAKDAEDIAASSNNMEH